MSLWQDLKAKHSYKTLGSPRISIGIPTINRKDLLIESLKDISINLSDDIHELVIVDNGNQSIDDIIPHTLKSKTTIYTEDSNLGVSGSWNKIIKKTLYGRSSADHLLLLNDDVVLGKRFEDLLEIIESYPRYNLLNCHYYWSAFFITKECTESIGFFDDKFFPAYFEDNDYARRHSIYFRDKPGQERFEDARLDPQVQRNSSTIRQEPSLNSNFGRNANYYLRKWGGGLGHERWEVPFNGEPQADD